LIKIKTVSSTGRSFNVKKGGYWAETASYPALQWKWKEAKKCKGDKCAAFENVIFITKFFVIIGTLNFQIQAVCQQ
jgi:hypothetical protein